METGGSSCFSSEIHVIFSNTSSSFSLPPCILERSTDNEDNKDNCNDKDEDEGHNDDDYINDINDSNYNNSRNINEENGTDTQKIMKVIIIA